MRVMVSSSGLAPTSVRKVLISPSPRNSLDFDLAPWVEAGLLGAASGLCQGRKGFLQNSTKKVEIRALFVDLGSKRRAVGARRWMGVGGWSMVVGLTDVGFSTEG